MEQVITHSPHYFHFKVLHNNEAQKPTLPSGDVSQGNWGKVTFALVW